MNEHRRIITDRNIIFFDLETTGVEWRTDRIVQFAATVYLPASGGGIIKGREISFLVDPGIPIPPAASDIHKIYDADVRGAGVWSVHAAEVIRLMTGAYWAGYNIASFDVPLLIEECRRHGFAMPWPSAVIDVFEVFKAAFPRTLQAAIKFYLGEATAAAAVNDLHDAAVDIDYTARVLWKQLLMHTEIPLCVGDLVAYCRPDGALDLAGKLYRSGTGLYLNFGKYRGQDVFDVPIDYMQWAMKNVFQQDAIAFITRYIQYRRKQVADQTTMTQGA